MAIKKYKFGKVVAQYQGYRIRHLLEPKKVVVKKKEVTKELFNGKFGIYAGKKLILGKENFKSTEKAIIFLKKYLKNLEN